MASNYPGSLDSFVAKADGEDQIIYASHVNNLQNAVVAVEAELGTDPAGSASDLKTRLAVVLTASGAFMGPQQVKIVAKAGGEYTTIQSAIDAISDAGANKRYAVLVFPGLYNEAITLKDYVSLQGVNRYAVVLTASGNVIALADHSQVRSLTIDKSNSSGESMALHNDTDVTISDVTTIANESVESSHGIILADACGVVVSNCNFIDTAHGDTVFIETTATGLKMHHCRVDGRVYLESDSTVAVSLCAMYAAIRLGSGASNLIATPYNVVDTDI